jgi:hypothetical protein
MQSQPFRQMQGVIELQLAGISPLPFVLGHDGSEFGVTLPVSVKAVNRRSDARICLTMAGQVAVAAGAGFVLGSRQLGVTATMVAVTIGTGGYVRRVLRLMMDWPGVALQAPGISALRSILAR